MCNVWQLQLNVLQKTADADNPVLRTAAYVCCQKNDFSARKKIAPRRKFSTVENHFLHVFALTSATFGTFLFTYDYCKRKTISLKHPQRLRRCRCMPEIFFQGR